jgi:hypothetical protein
MDQVGIRVVMLDNIVCCFASLLENIWYESRLEPLWWPQLSSSTALYLFSSRLAEGITRLSYCISCILS